MAEQNLINDQHIAIWSSICSRRWELLHIHSLMETPQQWPKSLSSNIDKWITFPREWALDLAIHFLEEFQISNEQVQELPIRWSHYDFNSIGRFSLWWRVFFEIFLEHVSSLFWCGSSRKAGHSKTCLSRWASHNNKKRQSIPLYSDSFHPSIQASR